MSDETMEATRSTVGRWLDGIAAGRPGTELADYLADDVTWTLMGSLPRSRTYSGKDEVLGFFGGVGERFRPGSITRTPVHVLVEGAWAAVELARTGITLAGAEYRNQHLLMIRVRGSRFVEVREYIDTLAASRI